MAQSTRSAKRARLFQSVSWGLFRPSSVRRSVAAYGATASSSCHGRIGVGVVASPAMSGSARHCSGSSSPRHCSASKRSSGNHGVSGRPLASTELRGTKRKRWNAARLLTPSTHSTATVAATPWRASPVAMVPDHLQILAAAMGRLRSRLRVRPIAVDLVPPVFTLLDLAAVGGGDPRAKPAQAEFQALCRGGRRDRGDRHHATADRRASCAIVQVPPGRHTGTPSRAPPPRPDRDAAARLISAPRDATCWAGPSCVPPGRPSSGLVREGGS